MWIPQCVPIQDATRRIGSAGFEGNRGLPLNRRGFPVREMLVAGRA